VTLRRITLYWELKLSRPIAHKPSFLLQRTRTLHLLHIPNWDFLIVHLWQAIVYCFTFGKKQNFLGNRKTSWSRNWPSVKPSVNSQSTSEHEKATQHRGSWEALRNYESEGAIPSKCGSESLDGLSGIYLTYLLCFWVSNVSVWPDSHALAMLLAFYVGSFSGRDKARCNYKIITKDRKRRAPKL
jgi:hypothetical protein